MLLPKGVYNQIRRDCLLLAEQLPIGVCKLRGSNGLIVAKAIHAIGKTRALLVFLENINTLQRGSRMQDNPRGFSTEAELGQNRAEIEAVWAARTQGKLLAADGVAIAYAFIEPENRREQAIVISPGRTEFIDKYSELAFDFYRLGFAVYVIDHRGQGFSDRLLEDSHKGHVADFEDYVVDLHQLFVEVLSVRESAKPFLVGHSMGGAIVARFLQLYPDLGAGGVLCSPMLEINTGAPQRIIWPILSRIESLLASPDKEPGYVPGGVPYEETQMWVEGKLNRLTSSEARLEYFNQQYLDYPQVQLGSPTRHWLLRAFEGMASILADVERIQAPIAVLVSGGDRIVREGGVTEFVERLQQHQSEAVPFLRVEGAEHELLMESDEIRLQALNFLMDFIEREGG